MYIIRNQHNHHPTALVIAVYDLHKSIGNEMSKVKFILFILPTQAFSNQI